MVFDLQVEGGEFFETEGREDPANIDSHTSVTKTTSAFIEPLCKHHYTEWKSCPIMNSVYNCSVKSAYCIIGYTEIRI